MKMDKVFRELSPRLSDSDYMELEQSILDGKCRRVVIVNGYSVIDEFDYYEICEKHGITYSVSLKRFESRKLSMEWIIIEQLRRKDLSFYERSLLVLKLEKLVLSNMSKEEQSSSPSYALLSACDKKRALHEELGRIAGVGHDTVERTRVIESEASPQQKTDLLQRNKTLNKVYMELRPRKVSTTFNPPLPKVVVKDEEKIVCSTCGVSQPVSHFTTGRGACRSCRNFLKTNNNPDAIKEIRAMNAHVVDGVDTILESMKTKKSSEEDSNALIYNESIAQLEEIVNDFNIKTNKYMYMGKMLKGYPKQKEMLRQTIINLKKIINLMEEC